MKKCTKCGQEKPLDQFHPRRDRPGGKGVVSRCKECLKGPARERTRKWYADNREEANLRSRERYRANIEVERERNRERSWRLRQDPARQEYERRWREENREHLRAYHRKWREANRERVQKLARQSNKRNREARNAYIRKRKDEQRRILDDFKRDCGCLDCGTSVGLMEFDHRPGEEKSFNVSHGTGCSWETIWAEVAKCDVRCGTCHRKRHAGSKRGAPPEN